jgi:NADPH-dependent 2,4-dienoyl-CoA reductase/sulfur reductase-like enzyme
VTSNPNIFAAGDNAYFPYQVFDSHRRVEHWDNALNQGKYAGWNMAGQMRSYDYMPYFFSDLFDFGYEAVGQVDSRLEIFADWQEENKKGVIYYLDGGMVSGVMLCNVWEHVDWARDLIRRREPISKGELSGLLSAKTQT